MSHLHHALQAQRFELKYQIPSSLIVPIRDFVRSYLVLDEFGEGSPDFSYPVHSIYLDSDKLDTYHWSLNGNKNRYKLRVRFYDDNPKGPVFFEFKRRMNDCILKERCGVRRHAAAEVMAGYIPDPKNILSSAPNQLVSLQRFITMMHDLQAVPKSHVAYMREAWVSPHDNSVRVTMDQKVRCEPCFELKFQTHMENPLYVFGKENILEVKFTNRYPNWIKEMIQVFKLMQCGGAKYAWGMEQVGEHSFSRIAGDGGLAPEPGTLLSRDLKRARGENA
ncbi:MAG: polyphosphate polymerase domain-containing protein [Verrucomicrobiota bacterium]